MNLFKHHYEWTQRKSRILLKVDLIRFMIVGSVGFLLTAVSLKELHGSLKLQITLATLISSEVGLISNFFFHEKWTYNNVDHHHKPIKRKFVHFHMSSWSGVALITIIETVEVKVLKLNYLISLTFAAAITLFWNFFWTKYYIFKGKTPKALLNPEDIVSE